MTLRDLLHKNRSAIVGRWQAYALAAYAPEAAKFFGKRRDRFANPVGHALRAGTEGIFARLLDGMDAEDVCGHLDQIVKMRAIQELSPSQAISFVFSLKSAIRDEIGRELLEPRLASELAEVDAQIDQVALFAFDIYTRCREKVVDLRINEIKRSAAAAMQRLGEGRDPVVEPSGPAEGGGHGRGGGQ